MINSKVVERWKSKMEKFTEYDPDYWKYPAEILEDAIYEEGAELLMKRYNPEGSVVVKWKENGKVYRYVSYWPAHSEQYTIREVKE